MSVPYAAGGLYSTVLDLRRWSDALATNALVDADAMRRFDSPLPGHDRPMAIRIRLWRVCRRGGRASGCVALGRINGFVSNMARYPDDALTVVLLTNREDAGDVEGLTASVARLVLDSP